MNLPARSGRSVRLSAAALPAAIFLSGLAGGGLRAAPGDLDPGWGGTGVVINSTIGVESLARAVAIQPDGKVVVAGYAKASAIDMIDLTVVRYLPDGTLDTSFGNGTGFFMAGFPELTSVLSVVVQPDGKILTAGSFQGFHPNPATLMLTRFLPDGALDTSFNGTGFLILPAVEWFTAGAVALQSDGKILAAGGSGPGLYSKHFTVMRFMPNGSPDLTFNGTGKVVTAMGTVTDEINAMVLQKDGKILVAGTAESTAPPGSAGVQTAQFALARYLPDGSLDPDFNDTGKFLAGQALEFNAKAECLTVQEDGKILAGGLSWPNMALLRLDAQGRLDTTFNGTGQATYPQGSLRPLISSLMVDSTGRILAVGGPRDEEAMGPAFVMQVLPNGQLDPSFRGTGFMTTNLGGSSAVFFAAAMEKSGTLLAAGGVPKGRSKLAVARFKMGNGIAVEYPAGTRLSNNSTAVLDFGPVAPGTSFLELTVRNTEGVPLTGLTVSLTGLSNPGEFAVVTPPPASLPAAGTATFTLAFAPSATPGPHTATLQVRGTAGTEFTFSTSLTGRRATPSEVWRYTWFASYENAGAGADQNDFDRDGMVNLVEFALGSHPHQGALPDAGLVINGNGLEYTFSRAVASLTELIHQPEFAFSTAGPWSAAGITVTVVSDDGVMQKVKAVAPLPVNDGASAVFVRLRVSRR